MNVTPIPVPPPPRCASFKGHLCPAQHRLSAVVIADRVTYPFDSSVGRAVDCSRIEQISIGRWFKSGSKDFFST
jgi:hypothetical protein